MNVSAVSLPGFQARAPWWGGDLQTARNALLRDHADLSDWPEDRLRVETPDGDLLSAAVQDLGADKNRLVVLVHGLTGCEDSAYVRATARHLLEAGYAVVRFNLRGAGPSRPDCRAMYHAGRSEDLALLIDELVAQGRGRDGLFAVGYSLGGNLLLKYLAESGAASPLAAAVSVSAPIDLAAASTRLEAGRNRGYHRWLLDRMKQDWRAGPLDISPAQSAALDAARTIRAFDDGVVGPINGFAGATEYYAACSAGPRLTGIAVPTLMLHGDDDPWIPSDAYRNVANDLPDNLRIEIARGGGHVGFHGRGGRWHDRCARAFFDARTA